MGALNCIILIEYIINIRCESTQMSDQFYQQPDEEMNRSSTPKCRLCGEEEGELISPCRCSGNEAYVHYNCLANQIETARIMKVANVDGFYNSRCTLCKFHIQFKIQEYRCAMNKQDIKQAIKGLDEDTTAFLSLNLPIIIVLFAILLVIVSQHVRSELLNKAQFNWKLLFLQLLLSMIEYFLIRNVIQRFPTTIKKPVLVSSTSI